MAQGRREPQEPNELMGVLAEILRTKRDEIPSLRRARLPAPPPRRSVQLRRAGTEPLRLMAEIKRRSPSAGPLSTCLSVSERAAAYERGGATVISVLCDRTYFGGSFEHLTQAREGCSLPLLCKEFVLDEAQLDAARAFGADLVLLIVRCVTADALPRLVAGARARELVPLVEVHGAEDVRAALDAGADLIGVNARDLDTLEMNAERALAVLGDLPDAITCAYLSGLSTPGDVRRVAATRADAALLGEALMRQDDPEPLLRTLRDAARTI